LIGEFGSGGSPGGGTLNLDYYLGEKYTQLNAELGKNQATML
jgi:hypothetical protein